MNGEEWRDIPGFEGRYQVSDQGNVRSLERWVNAGPAPGKRLVKAKTLVPFVKRYPEVHLQPGDKTFRVHVLVMLAFVGPCPEGMEVCHEDDDPLNNLLSNLRYGTHASNFKDIGMKRREDGRFLGRHRDLL